MLFDVMSERDAIAFSHDPDILPCVIVSIRDDGDAPVQFADNPNILAVLHMAFDDTEEELLGAITDAQAAQIASFVLAWCDRVESVVVHCFEGISRSSGVCAALMRHINGDADEILTDVAYRPNRRCYRKVLAALDKAE